MKQLSSHSIRQHRSVEPLESRIAPAGLPITNVVGAVVGSPIPLHAGDLLSTSALGGSYLLFVESGSALVYTTDLNHNNQVDFNEITGIAAGDGLSLISFVDIHGDIVTDLKSNGTLTDSDNNANNGLDGRVLLNSHINKLELRSLSQADLTGNQSVEDRLALSTYSLFGNIYAGGGFGSTGAGLTLDTAGKTLQMAKFSGATGISQFVDVPPEIGSIKVGTAASGQLFSFGTSPAGFGLGFNGEDVAGTLVTFRPAVGADGADITGLHIADDTTPFNLGTLQAGDGGFNGRGGDIRDITITGDMAGGYKVIAGNAADGTTGRQGGSIVNFQDLGSVTSEVDLKSGDGGRGLIGAGGAAGTIDLVGNTPINIAGRLFVTLGKGGDGLTAGGAGGSQTTGILTTPEGAIPSGANVAATTHLPGDIFNTKSGSHVIRGFDFDLDGYNDVVYTSNDPNQLVVLFGSATGFDEQGTRYPGASGTLYLNGPANAEALTVADLNGDGHPDIAVASQDSSSAGVKVFLSKYVVDPVTQSPTFAGFQDPISNALPHLGGFGFFQKAIPVTALSAGDFDGDGIVDLAINTVQTNTVSGKDSNIVMVLRGDVNAANAPTGTGHFFADFANGTPVAVLSSDITPAVHLHASALSNGGQDYLFAGAEDSKTISLYDYTTKTAVETTLSLGSVDTDRKVSALGMRDHIVLKEAKLNDFTILDANNDGNADIVVLTSEPAGFLITLQGSGTKNGYVIASNDPSDDTGGRTDENTGISIAGAPPEGLGIKGTLVGILTTAAQADGTGNDVSVISYAIDPNRIVFNNLSFPTLFTATDAGQESVSGLQKAPDPKIAAFDTYRPIEANAGMVGYTFALPSLDRSDDFIVVSPAAGGDFVSIANNGYFFRGGDGGNSSIGHGGAGGQIGKQLMTKNGLPVGTLSIVVPTNLAFEPVVRFIGGDGGLGYTGGGKGGDVRGVTVKSVHPDDTFNVSALLFAGQGGDAVKGTGGDGGSLSGFSILGGEVIVAGDGGRGLGGGKGGSVLGNKLPGFPDVSNTQTVSLAVQGGKGGLGSRSGGAGGSVVDFTPSIRPVLGGEVNSVLLLRGGAGGNALSGTAGAGGSIVNSSPVSAENNLVSDIQIEGGQGGMGLTGGKGGSIVNFVNSPGQGSLPLSASVIAGNGGVGTARNGGAGGDIAGVNISARGVGFHWAVDFSHPENTESFPGAPDQVVNFGRFIAGAGGASDGGIGGLGGNISSVTAIASSSSFALAAGRGGDGLRGGAAGGNVSNATVDAAASLGKALVIAGDGGDGYGALAIPGDPLAPGGINAPGGNGGNINGVSQNAQNTVVDLIAGNGGSTINFGTSLDLTTKVGRGGSISNISVVGDIGDIAASHAIVAYNDINSGEQISDFVMNTLIGTPGVDLRTEGNVGIVVGAAGRVKDNNHDGMLDPSSVGINGSLSNVLAANIMSAVAGSVDRIASIQMLTSVNVRTESAIYGADKSAPPPATAGRRDYLSGTGVLIETPELGGALLDGAIIAKNERATKSIRDFIRR